MLEIKDLKVYIQAFQGKPWNEECDSAYNGFKQLGFQVELFTTTEQLKIWKEAIWLLVEC